MAFDATKDFVRVVFPHGWSEEVRVKRHPDGLFTLTADGKQALEDGSDVPPVSASMTRQDARLFAAWLMDAAS